MTAGVAAAGSELLGLLVVVVEKKEEDGTKIVSEDGE